LPDNQSKFTEIKFLAEKVHAHHWPLDTPKWSDLTIKQVDDSLNNKEKKQIAIKSNVILIENYKFTDIKKVGLTIPLFQKQSTLVFEGCFENLYAHVHITTKSKDYLEIFNKLMHWRSRYFPDSLTS
jgi:hypothetical protein